MEELDRLDAEAKRIGEMADDAAKEVRELQDKLGTAMLAGGAFEAEAKRVESVLQRLRGDTCPTCWQPISQAHRDKLTREAHGERDKATKAKDASQAERESLEAMVAELEDELRSVRIKHGLAATAANTAHHAIQQFTREQCAVQTAAKKVQEVEQALVNAEVERANANKSFEEASARLRLLLACEGVLGLKGVRAHVLGKALGGIQDVANSWLSKMVDGVSLRLGAYSEKKSGGTTDAISLCIDGVGAGFGYTASSGGERRRVDVALLLALAEVAAAASGTKGGTLWFDEVFDTLDNEGVERAISALRELAEHRCVVVITHSQAFTRSSLCAEVRFQASNGTFKVV
jgi:DNA repair exonuclease SbcCD ATPase subunit